MHAGGNGNSRKEVRGLVAATATTAGELLRFRAGERGIVMSGPTVTNDRTEFRERTEREREREELPAVEKPPSHFHSLSAGVPFFFLCSLLPSKSARRFISHSGRMKKRGGGIKFSTFFGLQHAFVKENFVDKNILMSQRGRRIREGIRVVQR